MMPMFHKDSKSPAMIKHSMDMIWNKGQPIAVALDQPMYAITKHIQWHDGQKSMVSIDSL